MLEPATARYVVRVHRLREGDRFVAFDPALRTEADCEILRAEGRVECRVLAVRASSAIAGSGVHLLQAIGKGDKPEHVILAATALGADAVTFVETERAVVRVGDRGKGRLERWRAVAVEAARQSGRGDLPELAGPVSLGAALGGVLGSDLRVTLSPSAERSVSDVLAERGPGQRLVLLIGPEGGLSPAEEDAARRAGFVAARLGRFVLRTEIAAIAALGAVAAQTRPGR